MKSSSTALYTRRALSIGLLSVACCFMALCFTETSFSQGGRGAKTKRPASAVVPKQKLDESAALAAFTQSVGGAVTPVIVELKSEPGVVRKVAAEQEGRVMSVEELFSHSQRLVNEQNAFFASLPQHGVRALLRESDVRQINGSVRHIEYRFTYLLNGFVAYVATEDVVKLRALPEVANVSVAESPTYFLDKAIDYSLGTQTNAADRRTAVYGPTHEFRPTDTGTHPETPRPKIDGFEGQNMKIAVIDTGVDWRHPMFGGTGLLTPTPRVSGEPESPDDNKKVIYYYALSSPGDPTDDFGHGTLVASCAAGFSVDGTTPPNLGYGTGKDGTGVGPTLNGAQLFGTAPQAQIMAYKVCGPANTCPGDIELAIEDAASPFTLVASGDPGPTPVSKPIADVINLSLGDTSGDPAGASSRAVNNAALAGTIVVASAGNAGPGAGTIGAPSAATLAISVAASLDPGSVSAADVLAPCEPGTTTPPCPTGQQPTIPGETQTPATPGPSPERGAASNANAAQPGERQAMKIFPAAGGGPIPDGSLSAHYVFVDRRGTPPPAVPTSVTNRIALVKGEGTFAQIANSIAPLNPAAIIIITAVESATAVVVVNGIPTFTMGPDDGNYLIDLMLTGDPGDGDPNVDVPVGTISELPLRLAESATLAAFSPSMAGFSSRGPNDHPNARFRTVKPDVSGPGVGIAGAATVEGVPDETVGLASTTGYTQANGTSFSGPITAGAMAVVRQYARETLGLDETDSAADQAKLNWRTRRFDSVTVARALLQNSATNLRSGFGVPQDDGAASIASINDMGAGHINVAGALQGKAIMVAPTPLLTTPSEYTPQPSPSPTPVVAMIPTASFGPVPVIGVNGTVVRTREVVIRDVASAQGAGAYNLTFQNNRLADSPGFQISFLAADGTTPTTSVTVPSGGQTSFFVRTAADGNQITSDPTEFQWYVTATHSSGQTLRMPFYYRAVTATIANITSPNQQAPTGTEQASSPCPVDTNGSYTIQWTYTAPSGGPSPVGFRVQEGTSSATLFFDNADEPLVGGVNSKWSGSAQWTTSVNPGTGSPAYFVPDAANQNESLSMVGTVALPAGAGATLSYVTTEDTEADFDFANVEISNNLGGSYTAIGSFSGSFEGTRTLDISGYAGQTIKVRFRMTSDLVVPAPGWWVEDIGISSDDFTTIAETGAGATSLNISGRPAGTYSYRVAALFPNPLDPGTTITGPYSNVQCVTVAAGPPPAAAVSRKMHGAFQGNIPLPLTGNPGIECRTGGGLGDHQVVFTFPGIVFVNDAEVTSGTGTVSSFTPSGTEITVNLTGVTNAQTIVVTLFGVNDGSTTGNVSVPMGVLFCDVNGLAGVTGSDVNICKSQVGVDLSESNFRNDVNVTGFVSGSDVNLVKSQVGTTLP